MDEFSLTINRIFSALRILRKNQPREIEKDNKTKATAFSECQKFQNRLLFTKMSRNYLDTRKYKFSIKEISNKDKGLWV